MPRYFLNLFNDVETYDEDGRDYVDLAAAKEVAIAGALELMAAHVRQMKPIHLSHRIEVADGEGRVLAVIPFRELITVNG